ncbi:MAG: alpha-1,2-fucosyltransferase [Candidatus Nanopelagicaceae bacterium]
MISFNYLGNYGRLGNQMFQYASLKGIARKHGYDFCIPPKENFGNKDLKVRDSNCDIYDVFNSINENNIAITNNKKLKESTLNFDEDLFKNCPDNVDLDGYFQSEKYFKHIENEIRKDFTFDEDILFNANKFLSEFYSSQDVISLHVRRTDYTEFPDHHPICSLDYYQKAISYFPEECPVIIFTDDEEWIETQSFFDDDRFIISQKNTADFDLCLMACCDYHIIANSSFSWWGAWLSKSKGVVAPQKWFGSGYSNWKIEDRVLENWILL